MKKKIDQLVLLNGGLGKRVRLISKQKPKCLIKFKKKTFLHHQLLLFKKNGIKEVVICAGYKREQIFSEISKINISNLKIKIAEEMSPLGTGGAIKNCIKYLDDIFFVTYGDSWLNLKFRNIEKKFLKKKKNLLSIIKKEKLLNHEPNILVKKNKIVDYNKGNISYNYVDYGLMILNKNEFQRIKINKFDLSILIKKLITSQSISFYKVRNKFYEIGSLKGIREFKKYIDQ